MSDDYLRCPVCRENFDTKSHVPLVGICGHSICKMCRENEVLTREEYKCPICRTEKAFANLTINYSLIDHLNKKEETRQKLRAVVAEKSGASSSGVVVSTASTSQDDDKRMEELEDLIANMQSDLSEQERKNEELEYLLKQRSHAEMMKTSEYQSDAPRPVQKEKIVNVDTSKWNTNQYSPIFTFYACVAANNKGQYLIFGHKDGFDIYKVRQDDSGMDLFFSCHEKIFERCVECTFIPHTKKIALTTFTERQKVIIFDITQKRVVDEVRIDHDIQEIRCSEHAMAVSYKKEMSNKTKIKQLFKAKPTLTPEQKARKKQLEEQRTVVGPDGKKRKRALYANCVKVFVLKNGHYIPVARLPIFFPWPITFAPNGVFAFAIVQNIVCMAKFGQTGGSKMMQVAFNDHVINVTVNNDGTLLGVIARHGVRVFRVERPKCLAEFDMPDMPPLQHLIFSADYTMICCYLIGATKAYIFKMNRDELQKALNDQFLSVTKDGMYAYVTAPDGEKIAHCLFRTIRGVPHLQVITESTLFTYRIPETRGECVLVQ